MSRGLVRRAVSADAGLLARLGAKTFRETFAASNTAEDMANYLAESFGPAIQAAEIAEPGTYFLILEIDGEAAGYARLSFGHPPAGTVLGQRRVDRPLEIVRFYIDRHWHGLGAAGELMQRCVAEADREGCDLLWLAVWEQNPRAIAFYRKWGFEVAGKKIFQLGSDAQTDKVMIRP
jgi:GNAT superfamily N-acetyltransferase